MSRVHLFNLLTKKICHDIKLNEYFYTCQIETMTCTDMSDSMQNSDCLTGKNVCQKINCDYVDSYACIFREFNIKKCQPVYWHWYFCCFYWWQSKFSANLWNCMSILELYLCIQHKTVLLSVPLHMNWQFKNLTGKDIGLHLLVPNYDLKLLNSFQGTTTIKEVCPFIAAFAF